MTFSRIRIANAWNWVTALVLVVGTIAPLWSARDVSAQTPLPTTAGAAPASTVIYHTMDLDRDGEQWQQTEALLARVGVPNALDLWEEAILEEGAAMGDFTAADFDALLGGEMAVVVLPTAIEHLAAMHMQMMAQADEATGMAATPIAATPAAEAPADDNGVVGVLDPGDLDAAWDYVRRQFEDLATQRGVSLEESTYEDAELLWVPPAVGSMDESKDHDGMDDWMGGHGMHGRSGIAAARAGDFIVAGKSEADVTSIVDVIASGSDTLADTAELQTVAAELPADALSLTYVDSQGILDALGPEMSDRLQVFMPDVPVEEWGGQSGFAISADELGFRVDSITIPAAGADMAAMVPDNDPAVATAAEQAPAGTFIFQAGRLAETAFVGAPYSLARAVNAGSGDDAYSEDQMAMMPFPTAEEMEQEIATATATLGFDPGADLFDLLGDEFIAFSSFPILDFENFENFGIDAVAAITTSDPAALAETAGKIADWIERSEPNIDVAAREVGSDTVYAVTSAEMEGMPSIEFGVVEDRAVVAVGGGIEDLLSEPAESLADDPQFQAVMDVLPGEYYQIGYVDIGQVSPLLTTLIGMMGEMDGMDGATPVATGDGPQNIRALGTVAFKRGEMSGTSAILYIADGG